MFYNNHQEINVIIRQLLKNQIVSLNLNGVFYLAVLDKPEHDKIFNNITKNKFLYPHLLCKDSSQAQSKISADNLDNNYLNFILQSLFNNESLSLLVNSFESINSATNSKTSSKVLLSTTNSRSLLQVLEAVNQPLRIVPACFNGKPPATNLRMLGNYYNQEMAVLETQNQESSQVLSTVLDCSDSKKVKVLRPGPIKYQEIQKILQPFEIELTQKWQRFNQPIVSVDFSNQNSMQKFLRKSRKIQLLDSVEIKDEEVAVIMGTKEKLKAGVWQSVFNIYIKKMDKYKNCILINMGSQTNPANIVHNLYSKIQEIQNFGTQKQIILNQKWGKSHWSEIIEYSLQNYTGNQLNLDFLTHQEGFPTKQELHNSLPI